MKKNIKQLNKGYFKSIPLHPSLFYLDVWVCDNFDVLCKKFNARYGGSVEYYKEELHENQVCTLRSTNDSELKGDKLIVMNLDSWDLSTIVHEIAHVLFHLNKIIGIEIDYKSQEWCAYFLEYLFSECKDEKTFKKLK